MINRNTIEYGTCHFVTRQAAYRYYAAYGFTVADVEQKLAAGDIAIGYPPIKPGEALLLDRVDGRYFIRAPYDASTGGQHAN